MEKINERRVPQSAAAVTTPRNFQLALTLAARFEDAATSALPRRVSKHEFPIRDCDWAETECSVD